MARHAPAAVRHLLAVLVAAGSDGINKDKLVAELWPDERPASWKSAIRNRITRARRHLGPDAILTVSNRYQLAPEVAVDSWLLINDEDSEDTGSLDFLKGKPFVDIAPTPVIENHLRHIRSARALRIRRFIDRSASPLPMGQLETLRLYQRENALDSTVAEQTVRALVMANELTLAHDVIGYSRWVADRFATSTAWIDQLEQRAFTDVRSDASRATSMLASSLSPDRATVFYGALAAEQWSVAYEVAMEGMPYAAPLAGDLDRVELLRAIPLGVLGQARAFQLAVTVAKLTRMQDPVLAQQWAQVARGLAESPDNHFLADVICSMVGSVDDERRLFTLPLALSDADVPARDLQSFQVGVKNYLERAAGSQSSAVCERFHELIEDSDEPYRRWLGLTLEAMLTLVDGDFHLALERAKQACEYGTLFGIVECDFGWRCQVFNPSWAATPPGRPITASSLFIDVPNDLLGRALRVASESSPERAEAFVDSFDIESRMSFCVPLLTMLGPQLPDGETRTRVRNRLSSRSGTSAILGASYMHLGPVDRALAFLTDGATQRQSLFEDAIGIADAQQTRLWQIICRLDLAIHRGEPPVSSDVKALATTPKLRELVDSYR